jgi:UDP-2,3-diacylglucosamine pyrophosphatase LpxH
VNNYKAIWISDIHLGTKVSNAKYLINFFKHNNAKKIYLVGDIIDGWELNKNWYWPQSHNELFRILLKKAKKSKIIFIPGNHDSFLREYIKDLKFSSINFKKNCIHKTKKGLKLYITHGDEFDNFRKIPKFLNIFGDFLYSFILYISMNITNLRNSKNLPHWSFAAEIKKKSNKVKNYINDYKGFMVNEAKRNDCNGVICGHIHHPEIQKIDNILYCNDGDWVESLSAIVEDNLGEIKLIYWKKII